MSSLLLNNFNDFYKYYFKTDHHWNPVGAYKGYEDIARMMGITPLKPAGKIKSGIKYMGSRAAKTASTDIKDDFTPYYFNFPKFSVSVKYKSDKTYKNLEKQYGEICLKEYGAQEIYVNNWQEIYDKTKKKPYFNHYWSYYGAGHPKLGVIKNLENKNKKNLLIIGSSMDNPLIKPLASHFQNTYTIDLREDNAVFDIKQFIEEHKITDFLYNCAGAEVI
jgi:hypothetical protein